MINESKFIYIIKFESLTYANSFLGRFSIYFC